MSQSQGSPARFLHAGEHQGATRWFHPEGMETSTYDLSVQLTLATTAASEGDIDAALEYLAEAERLALELITAAPVA
jgi:hypothetical protein